MALLFAFIAGTIFGGGYVFFFFFASKIMINIMGADSKDED